MRKHSLRWDPEKVAGLHHAQVFVAGKWRTSYIACRKPRKFKRRELDAIRHMVWLNTGKRGQPEDVELIVE